MNNPEIQPTLQVRKQIILECEGDHYLAMKMLYTLAPIYYDRQYQKYL